VLALELIDLLSPCARQRLINKVQNDNKKSILIAIVDRLNVYWAFYSFLAAFYRLFNRHPERLRFTWTAAKLYLKGEACLGRHSSFHRWQRSPSRWKEIWTTAPSIFPTIDITSASFSSLGLVTFICHIGRAQSSRVKFRRTCGRYRRARVYVWSISNVAKVYEYIV